MDTTTVTKGNAWTLALTKGECDDRTFARLSTAAEGAGVAIETAAHAIVTAQATITKGRPAAARFALAALSRGVSEPDIAAHLGYGENAKGARKGTGYVYLYALLGVLLANDADADTEAAWTDLGKCHKGTGLAFSRPAMAHAARSTKSLRSLARDAEAQAKANAEARKVPTTVEGAPVVTTTPAGEGGTTTPAAGEGADTTTGEDGTTPPPTPRSPAQEQCAQVDAARATLGPVREHVMARTITPEGHDAYRVLMLGMLGALAKGGDVTAARAMALFSTAPVPTPATV